MKKIALITIIVLSQNVLADGYGVFMVVKGKVKIQNANATVDAKLGSKIQTGETVITENESMAKIAMMDRNIIYISPNTKMKIEKYTNTEADKNVSLSLIEGKIRNKVVNKYDNKDSKFEVRTATAVAGVRGTDFITTYNSATKVTEVITLRGNVSFQSLLSAAAGTTGAKPDPVMINRGEKSETKEDGVLAPTIKVPEKELKQIDSDTTVKRKQPDKGNPNNPPAPGSGNAVRGDDKAPPPAGVPLVDLNKGNTQQIIDGAATRKFDKSKVRIITQPSP